MTNVDKVTSLPAMIKLLDEASRTGRALQVNDDNSIQFATLDTRIDRILSGIGKTPEWHRQRDEKILANVKAAIDQCAVSANAVGSENHGKLMQLAATIKPAGHHQSAAGNYTAALVNQKLLPDSTPRADAVSAAGGSGNGARVALAGTDETTLAPLSSLSVGRFFATDVPASIADVGNPRGTKWGEALLEFLEPQFPDSLTQLARDKIVTSLRKNFTEFFEQSTKALQTQIPKGDPLELEFFANSQMILQEIIGECLSKDFHPSSWESIPPMAFRAQYEARKSLISLRDTIFGPQSSTKQAQVTPFLHKESGTVRFNVITKAPPIETLVFSGGGMKATGIGASIEEFIRFGKYDHVKKMVGSSAGALTSTFLATGMSMERFNQLNEKLASFTSAFLLADDHFNRFDQYKSIKFDSKDGLTHSMGMLVALDEETAKVVDEFLTENQPLLDAAVKDGRITKDDAKHLRRLVNQNFHAENREKSMVTFRDLKILASIAPGRFRELALTGFMPSEQKMAIFDAERTPDLQVAYAARASMAAPLAFTSVTLNGVKYIDGGLGSNQPVDVVHGDKQGVELEESHARTVLFSFDANGEALKALHDAPSSPGFVAKYITNPWMWLWGKTDIAGADIADAARQNSMGPQTMVVYHGDLGSFSFLASSDRKDLAVAHSRVMMQEQLLQRENQGMSRVFETITDVVKALDAEDRAAFLKAHAGIKFPDDPSEVDATTAAVYDLLKALGAAEAA